MSMSGTAHGEAERACFGYLQKVLGGTENESCFLGDILPLKSGVWAFHVSGGPTQDQNFQVTRAGAWLAYGHFIGQYTDRPTALAIIDRLLTSSPAFRQNGEPGATPNVRLFEITSYPQIQSEEVEQGDRTAIVFIVSAEFRVVFTRLNSGG